jgi:hypothetical protein
MTDQPSQIAEAVALPEPAPPRPSWRVHVIAVAVLAALTLAIFADVLFLSPGQVIGKVNTADDLFKQFAYWRQFGFGELAKGNLALWNPHIFCGSPYFGGMQSALLYPPNWLFMVLPLATALNLSMALNLWLTGVFMYAWASYRRLGVLASLTAAVVLMLSGAVFLQLLPGHLPHLCTMAWAPLVLLAVDALIDRPSLGWVLVGTLAVAMQVLAGHPQYFFYTAVTAGVYGLVNLVKARRRWVSLGAIAAMFAAAAAIAAVQLLTTVSESSEVLRSGGLDIAKAAQYSFPPENFACFLAPAFFGGVPGVDYWGRWFSWEVQPFIGVAGLGLALYGAILGPSSKRRFSAPMVLILLVLAMGGYLPWVFRLTHDYLPGFDRFRNSGRFLYPATMFLAMLAGVGLQALVSQRRSRLGSAAIAGAVAIALVVAGLALRSWASDPQPKVWPDWLHAMQQSDESWLAKGYPQMFSQAGYARHVGVFASQSVLIAAATAGLIALIFVLTRLTPRAGYLLAVVVLAELVVFDRFTQRPTFELAADQPPELCQLAGPTADESRILDPLLPDLAMTTGGLDLWGYDSFVLRRYMQFIYFTQGWPADNVDYFQHVGALQPTAFLTLLRCRAVLLPQNGRMAVIPLPSLLGRLQLVGQYRLCDDPDKVLAALRAPDFDPCRTVILEEPPAIAPAGIANAGWAKVTDSSTDCLTIQAELSAPAILLITDAYSKFWRARALAGSSQKDYTVMPADYCLRAVPLAAGRHAFRLEYLPTGFLVGRWVSGAAVAAYVVTLVLYLLRRRRGRPAVQ